MKNTVRLFGIIAFFAVIGFGIVACGDDESGDPTTLPHTHAWGTWADKTAATCTEAKIQERVCSTCPEKQTQNVGASLGHVGLSDLPATCTSPGYTGTGTCTRCFVVITGTVVNAKGHTPNLGTGLCTECNALTYNIGDTGPGGGKIIYRNVTTFGTNWHYLEAAPADLGSLRWASTAHESTTINVEGQVIGTGRANTALILSIDASAPAAKACVDYRGPNNLTDWHLPNEDEIMQLYKQRSLIGISSGGYWASNVYGNQNAIYMDFGDGEEIFRYTFKSAPFNVRAIRAF